MPSGVPPLSSHSAPPRARRDAVPPVGRILLTPTEALAVFDMSVLVESDRIAPRVPVKKKENWFRTFVRPNASR